MLCGACYFLCNISRMNWGPPPSLTLKAPQLLSPFSSLYNLQLWLAALEHFLPSILKQCN